MKLLSLSSFFLLVSILPIVYGDLNSDKQALLNFASSVPHGRKLNWNVSSPICTSWAGVSCNHEGTRVISVRLPGIGLVGPIPPGTLGKLDALKILSLRSNNLNGNVPSDIPSLPCLHYLFLQDNNFSGSIPESLSPGLILLDLSSNSLTGNIPSTISNLTHLTVLSLQENELSGTLPGVFPPRLKLLDLSHNKFHGFIPYSLRKFPKSSFLGNPLCGPPLGNCLVGVPSPAPSLSSLPPPVASIESKKRDRKSVV